MAVSEGRVPASQQGGFAAAGGGELARTWQQYGLTTRFWRRD